MLMKLCGLILYMVTRKFLHSYLSHEFCDIVVKLVNYGCDIVVKPVMLLTCEMMMLNFVSTLDN
jgi:hypothetical protein